MKLRFIFNVVFCFIFLFSLSSICEDDSSKKPIEADEVLEESQSTSESKKDKALKKVKEIFSKAEDIKLLAEDKYKKHLESLKSKLEEFEVPEKAEKAWNQFWGLELVDKTVLAMAKTPEDVLINVQQYLRAKRFNDKSSFFIKVVRSDLINPNDSDFRKLKMYINRYNKQIEKLNEKKFKSEKIEALIKEINFFKTEVNQSRAFSKTLKLSFHKEKKEFSFTDLEKVKKSLEKIVSASSFFQTGSATFISLKKANTEAIKRERANKAEEQKRFENLLIEQSDLPKELIAEKVNKIFERLSDFLGAESFLTDEAKKSLPEGLEDRLRIFKEITGELTELQTEELEKAYTIQRRLDALEEMDTDLEERISQTKQFISQIDLWMKTIFEYHAENMSLKIVDIFNRILPAIDSEERYDKLISLFRNKEVNHGFYKIFQERPFHYTGAETTFWVVLNLENDFIKSHIMKDLGFNENNALKFINQFNADGRTAVHEALIAKDYNKLSYILNLKADPNISSRKSIFGLGKKTTSIDFALKAASNYRPRLTKTEAYDFFIRPVLFSFKLDLDSFSFLNKKILGKTNLERLKEFLPGDKIQKNLNDKIEDFRILLSEQIKKEKEELSQLKEAYHLEKEDLEQKELSDLEKAQLKRSGEKKYLSDKKNIEKVGLNIRNNLKVGFNITPDLEDDFPEDIEIKRLNNYLQVISVHKRQNNLRALRSLFSDLVKDISFSSEDFLKSYKFLIKDAFLPDQIVDKDGNNLLMIALLHNQRLFKQMLLNTEYIQVSVNHLNKNKMTPLVLAIEKEKWADAIRLLEISKTSAQAIYTDANGVKSTPLIAVLKTLLSYQSYSYDDIKSVLRIYELITSKDYSWTQIDRQYFESLNIDVFSIAKEEELEKKRQAEKSKQTIQEQKEALENQEEKKESLEDVEESRQEDEQKEEKKTDSVDEKTELEEEKKNPVQTDERAIEDQFFNEVEDKNLRMDLVNAISFTLESYRWDNLYLQIQQITNQMNEERLQLEAKKGELTQEEIDLTERDRINNSRGAQREAVSGFLEKKLKQEINNNHLNIKESNNMITQILGLQDSFMREKEDDVYNYRKLQLLIEKMMVDAFIHGEEQTLKIMFSQNVVWPNILTSPEGLPEDLKKEYRNLFYSLSHSRNQPKELYQIVFDNFFKLVYAKMDFSDEKLNNFKNYIEKEVNRKDASGLTPLMHAVKNLADPYVILYLIQSGADTSIKSEKGEGLVHFLKQGHLKFNSSTETELVVDALINFLSIDDRAQLSKSLNFLVSKAHIEHYRGSLVRADAMTFEHRKNFLREKLERNIFKSIEDEFKKESLEGKISPKKPEDPKENKAEIPKRNEEQKVEKAENSGNEKLEKNLEESTEDEKIKDQEEKRNQFFQAVSSDQLKVVKSLIKEDFTLLKEKDISGNTALHLSQSLDMLRLLILEGADANSRNNESETPLIVFSKDRKRDSSLIEFLLKEVKGLDTRVRDSNNQNFYEIILESKDLERKNLVERSLNKRRFQALQKVVAKNPRAKIGRKVKK